ncbi:MAG: hypothetical protein AABY22_14585 [Nanoarchaeota archaeon]
MKKGSKEKLKIAKDISENKSLLNLFEYEPLLASYQSKASATEVRRNRAATIKRSDQYANIEDGLIPYISSSSPISSNSLIGISDAVVLCQKAYYNFANFRNTIDVMTEFTVGKIFLNGGNERSRAFFNSYFNKINLWSLQDRFFREFFRSGNVFIFPLMGTIETEDLKNLSKIFKLNLSEGSKVKIPAKFIIINPAEIQVTGSASFIDPEYVKVLTSFELSSLRSPRTDQDREILESFSPEVQKLIKNSKGQSPRVEITLDLDKVSAVFYKKQDYEPFAVPMGFPVLEDINWKAEMKKIDMAISRTVQQAILLITMGESPKDGGTGTNPKHIAAVQQFFQNESVARVLVADYTTKAVFVIPEIGDILDPKKYAQVNEDIREGLNNLVIGANDKFANASARIEVFVERLRHSRESFLTEFLIPEMKKIGENLEFKSIPMPYYKEIDIKDKLEFAKLYTRLIELGVLTPMEGVSAIKDGKIPNKEQSELDQEEFVKQKEKGYYEPIVGGPFTQKETMEMKQAQITQQGGRPSGTKKPQSKKNVRPIGASISISKIVDNYKKFDELVSKMEKDLLKEHNIKNLNKKQKETINEIAELITANEDPENWIKNYKDYLKEPIDKNKDRVNDIIEYAQEFGVDVFAASILYASRI